MLKCKEVARILASDELDGAGWKKRLSVGTHLLMCRHCRHYAEQLRALGAAARDLLRRQSTDSEALKRLENSILKDEPPGSSG
jgi:predicted anti-sigma-YlaC factor YlaD